MENTGLTGAPIPNAATFRAWVVSSLDTLAQGDHPKLIISVVSVNSGMSVNLLGQFISGYITSVSLDKSASLQKYLGQVASDRGLTLPVCGGANDGN